MRKIYIYIYIKQVLSSDFHWYWNFFFFFAVLGHFRRLFSFSSIILLGTEKALGIKELLQMTILGGCFRLGHTEHCWRSRDELIRDVLLWTHPHGRAKAGRPARTYIQQLCEDTGCCPEDLPRAMNDKEEWRERVRDIRATSATWRWWY